MTYQSIWPILHDYQRLAALSAAQGWLCHDCSAPSPSRIVKDTGTTTEVSHVAVCDLCADKRDHSPPTDEQIEFYIRADPVGAISHALADHLRGAQKGDTYARTCCILARMAGNDRSPD